MNETKKTNETPQYKCGICGSAFKTIKERANCELMCARNLEEAAKKAAETQKKEEQKKRKAEVDRLRAEYLKAKSAYIEDYGVYTSPVEFSHDTEDYNAWVEELLHKIFE